jgi:hypothetical protein
MSFYLNLEKNKMAKNFLRILSFFIFPALVFILNFLIGHCFGVYSVFPDFDIIIHFLGGFSIAFTSILFLNFFKEKKYISVKNRILLVFIVVCFVGFVAILWEFFEYLLVYFFNVAWQGSIEDTLGDFLMGILGGLFGGILFTRFKLY